MRSFFLSILIIVFAGVSMSIYYLLKHRLIAKKRKRLNEKIRRKMYEDERIYFQNQLRYLLKKLINGDIRWLVIMSRLDKSFTIEIVYSSLKKMLELRDHARPRNTAECQDLEQLGAVACNVQGGVNLVYTPLNAKILVDIIYYLYGIIIGFNPFLNLQIKESGD